MKSFLLWPSWPLASLLVLFVVAEAFLWAARVPFRRALRDLGRVLGASARAAGTWAKEQASRLVARDRERILTHGRFELESKIAREFRRVEGAFTRELERYPEIGRRLDDVVARVDADYAECGVTPPDPPGWAEAVTAIASAPKAGDRVVEKLLGEIHKSAIAGQKTAIAEFRECSRARHKILAAMAPRWKEIKGLLAEMGASVTRGLESARKVDGYIAQYESVQKADEATARGLAGAQTNLFVISAIVMAVALGGAFVNFQLIRLPMSELVPSGTRIGGIPVPTIAALVIVLMEVAAGVFLTETLGFTNLFPKLELLPASRRRLLLTVSFMGLLLLASVESSLAILREHLVEADTALKASLAGAHAVAGGFADSRIPVIGQAVLGFVLPWILAMVAVPLESLIQSSAHVGTTIVSAGLVVGGGVIRLLGTLVRGVLSAVRNFYDVLVVIPLGVEKLVRARLGEKLEGEPETPPRAMTPAPEPRRARVGGRDLAASAAPIFVTGEQEVRR